MTGRLEKKFAVTIFVDVKSAQCDQSLIGLEVINPSEKKKHIRNQSTLSYGQSNAVCITATMEKSIRHH